MRSRSAVIQHLWVLGLLVTWLLAPSCGGGGAGTTQSLSVVAAAPLDPSGNSTTFINMATSDQLLVQVEITGGLPPIQVDMTLRDETGLEVEGVATAISTTTVVVGPVDASPLADGEITLEIVLSDATGGTSNALQTFVQKDTLPPLTPAPPVVMGSPSGFPTLVNSNNSGGVVVQVDAGGTFVGDETVTAIFGADPNESPSASSSPSGGQTSITLPAVDLSGLPDGPLDVTVVIMDSAGNTTETVTTFLVDTTVSSVVALSLPGSGSRPVDTVNLMNVQGASLTYTLSAEAGPEETLFVSISDGTQSVTATPVPVPSGGSGTLAAVDLSALSDGSLTVTARVEDDHGNVSPAFSHILQKDTLAPGLAALALPAGPANGAGIINAATVQGALFEADLSGDVSAGDLVDLTLSDGTASSALTATAVGPGALSLPPLDASLLPDGALTATARARDTAGNVSPDVVLPVTKDTTAPAAPLSVFVPSSGLNPAGYVNQSTTSSATLSVNLPAGLEAGLQLEVSISDGTSVLSITESAPAGGGAASFPNLNLTGFAEGTLTLQARLIDPAGNLSAPTTGSALLDRSIGVPMVMLPAGPAQNAGYVSQASVSSATIDFLFPPSTGSSDIMSATVTGGGILVALPPIGLPQGGGQVALNNVDLSSIPDGSIQIAGTVTDPAGNVGTFGPVAFIKDTVPPSPLSAANVAPGALNPPNEVNASNVSQTILDIQWSPAVDGTETASLTISDLTGGSLTFGPFSPPTGGGMAAVGPFDLSALADGTLLLQATVQDLAGNTSTFSGTPAVKITSSLGAPTALHVPAGANNPADTVNGATAASVSVEVLFPSVYTGTEMVTVTLSDGTNSVTSPPLPAPAGGGLVTFSGLNASLLAEGVLSLTATITPLSGNPASYLGTPPTKDTLAPLAPTSLQVAAGPSNPAHGINAATASAVLLDVVWPAGSDTTAQATVELTAAGSSAVGTPFQAAAAGAQTVGPIDASALLDGVVSVQVTVTDPAGNSSVFAGAPAVKDTLAPSSAVGATVAAGTQNPANVVNTSNETTTFVDVLLDATSVATDTVSCTLSDGTLQVTAPTGAGIPGGGTLRLGPVDLSTLMDGSLTLQVLITDALGNSTTTTGTPAIKDTVPPAAASTAFVNAGLGNPADVINAANQSNVSIAVLLPNAAATGDLVQIQLDDGANAIQSAPLPAPAGGGLLTFSGLDATSLQDGSLTLSIDLIDASLNVTTAPGQPVTKDTVPPALPTAALLPNSGTNPLNVVNLANVNSPVFQVSLPASYLGSETVTLILTDGVGPILLSAPASPPAGGGTLTVAGPDLTALADGSISLIVSVSDLAGNNTKVNGSTLS
ncbi:MAG TPA: hypothetical protein ENK43_05685, partial [Planctomycetes bacterium]|nr:hypothetical protein [Planctomycetota bacterium]